LRARPITLSTPTRARGCSASASSTVGRSSNRVKKGSTPSIITARSMVVMSWFCDCARWHSRCDSRRSAISGSASTMPARWRAPMDWPLARSAAMARTVWRRTGSGAAEKAFT